MWQITKSGFCKQYQKLYYISNGQNTRTVFAIIELNNDFFSSITDLNHTVYLSTNIWKGDLHSKISQILLLEWG